MPSRLLLALALVSVAVASLLATARPGTAARLDQCGLPDERPLWLEFGGGSVPSDVRKVFSRPGVVVATAGTVLSTRYRNACANLAYFELKLPSYVVTPAVPGDPAGIAAAADPLYHLAVQATAVT